MPSMQRAQPENPVSAPALPATGNPVWESRSPAAGLGYWPAEQLRAFTLCMASHGMSVSASMMLCDRRYALETLACAHAMDDVMLRELAMELFRHFERVQSGVPRFN